MSLSDWDLNLQTFRKLVDALEEGVYITDDQRRIIYWNRGAEQITGFTADEVLGRPCSDSILTHVDEDGCCLCQGNCPLAAVMADGRSREATVYLHHKEGHRLPVSVRVQPIRDASGEVVGAAEVFSDVSNIQHLEEQVRRLERQAYVDPLTGLVNRRYASEVLHNKIEEMRRVERNMSVALLDIDHFKSINDQHGHQVGDRALVMVGQTLRLNARPFDVVARWGGEEFMLLLMNLENEELEPTLSRLRRLVSSSHFYEGEDEVRLTVSIGATRVLPEDTPELALARADELLYQSKQNGRNRVTVDGLDQAA